MRKTITGRALSRKVWIGGLNDVKELLPDESLRLRNHSPDGFAWGYAGSGPSQLALAILLKLTTQEKALKHYMDFKMEILFGLDTDKDFEIGTGAILAWLDQRPKA